MVIRMVIRMVSRMVIRMVSRMVILWLYGVLEGPQCLLEGIWDAFPIQGGFGWSKQIWFRPSLNQLKKGPGKKLVRRN